MFGLIGPDGAGKTTTIRLRAGCSGGRGPHRVLGRDPVARAPRDHRGRRLPLAALQPLRRSDHRREHRVLRRDPRRARLPAGARSAARDDAADAVPRPPRRPAVRRHEAEARARLHARARAADPAARRADDRRRSGVAPRVLEAAVGVPLAGPHDRHGDAVSGRGRALRARRAAARRPLLALDAPGDAAGSARRAAARGRRRMRRGRRSRRSPRCPASRTCRRSASARTCASPASGAGRAASIRSGARAAGHPGRRRSGRSPRRSRTCSSTHYAGARPHGSESMPCQHDGALLQGARPPILVGSVLGLHPVGARAQTTADARPWRTPSRRGLANSQRLAELEARAEAADAQARTGARRTVACRCRCTAATRARTTSTTVRRSRSRAAASGHLSRRSRQLSRAGSTCSGRSTPAAG